MTDQSLPVVETMAFTETRQHFSQVVNRVFRREARVMIEKNGIPVAALVSADDVRRLDEYDARRAERFAAMRTISRAFADVPLDELEARVAQALAEARAEPSDRRRDDPDLDR